jgi:DNA modification methylase
MNKTLGAIAPNQNDIMGRRGGYSVKKKVHVAPGGGQEQTGTSIFDPVLCEIAYRWFCPPKPAKILDPFAGGSVRGIVAAVLGHDYTGIELRPEQAAANEKQAADMGLSVRWVVGDSRNATTVAPGEYDFVFSCPPYYDLEVYSEDPNDLSTCGTYADFLAVYRAIIGQCVGMLRQDRFACFVVGDLRDERGFYRNFPADTIAAFQDAGAMLYNEAILVTAVGSLPIRCGRQFQTGRKLGKTHQNVLVFYKGDPKAIRTFGEVEAGEIAEGGDGLAQ